MIPTPAYAAASAGAPLQPFSIRRREPGPCDVLIDILYCGICHSDIHQVRDHWGGAIFPMVPGHEIVGTVARVGSQVEKWKVGDVVGVGCISDSCRKCDACLNGEEQFCERGPSTTYNGYEQEGRTPTYGGYSTQITIHETCVLRIPPGLPLEGAAPLLCAGISAYSPLRQLGVKRGEKLAVLGLGGLGHVAVKLGKAMGLNVTVLSHSTRKQADAMRLGADEFLSTGETATFEKNASRFHYLIDTVSSHHPYDQYLNLLRRGGTMVLLGLPEPSLLSAASLIMRRCRLTGSLIGGIAETQEMLSFCARHGIWCDAELISIQDVNEAYERLVRGDVRYRFVIDISSLKTDHPSFHAASDAPAIHRESSDDR